MLNNMTESSQQELGRRLYPREYQATYLFKRTFQASALCLDFRKAWRIPIGGFKDEKEFKPWYKSLARESNEYVQSEKYSEDQEQIQEKIKQESENKITRTELELFASDKRTLIPVEKFDYDIDQVTLESGKPVYWRRFIERCLLFGDFDFYPVLKPPLDLNLRWHNDSQSYDLTISNIFSDTTTKDFDDPGFTKKLKELQAKLPGHTNKKIRKKKNFEFGLQIHKVDTEHPGFSDVQKSEEIMGEVDSIDFGPEERRRAKKVRQTRYRLKQYSKSYKSH